MEATVETPEKKAVVEAPELEVTFEDLERFLNLAMAYKERYPKERSKATYAMTKQATRYATKYKDFAEDLRLESQAIRTKHASVDDKDNLIENKFDIKQGKGEDNSMLRFAYKKEAQGKMEAELSELRKKFNQKTLTIKPPYSGAPFFVEIPAGFDFEFLEGMKKFVFNPEIDEEAELQAYLKEEVKEQKPTIKSVLN